MATIKKREGKTGVSYLIRVSGGYDVSGSQVVHSMTWRPESGMKPKQVEKELQRQAVLFEEQFAGKGANGSIKFAIKKTIRHSLDSGKLISVKKVFFAGHWKGQTADLGLMPKFVNHKKSLQNKKCLMVVHHQDIVKI